MVIVACIPHELIVEILKKVRAKSLLRFRCVSKSFCSRISDPLFIEAHQKSCVAQFLVGCLAWTPKDVIYNLGQREEHQDLAYPIQYLDQPCFREFNYMQSIGGLVCLWNNVGEVAICNPFIKQHVFLPYQQPTGELYGIMTCCSLCVDPTTKKHKVFKAHLRNNERRYWVFTIGVDKLWREISGCSNFLPSNGNCVYIDGVIYWVHINRCNIAAFSVGDEKFIRMISFPDREWTLRFSEGTPRIAEIKGQVALLGPVYFKKSTIALYVLNGSGETDEWVKHIIELPLELPKTCGGCLCSLFTINPKGEILSLPDKNSSSLFLYDAGRKDQWKLVEIHGIYERKFLVEIQITVLLNIVDSIWPLRLSEMVNLNAKGRGSYVP
uniref:F-box protein At1g47790 n=1 Tax=Nicotiana sylvestris TaxID=4096 RepID=A0A1U7WXS8_NICSY|nr:PREDICTED: putative F-box protein At1g47790 [Nicotiana sylvestris]